MPCWIVITPRNPNLILPVKMLFPSLRYLSNPDCHFDIRGYLTFSSSYDSEVNLAWFVFPFCLQVMATFPSQPLNPPSCKHVLIQDKGSFPSSIQYTRSGEVSHFQVNPSIIYPNPEASSGFIEDNVPIVDPGHVFNVSTFEQLYLIGKIVGESLPLKLITFKCLAECGYFLGRLV